MNLEITVLIIIQKMNLFSLEDLFDLQGKTKLELIFEDIDLKPAVKSLSTNC